MVKIMSGGGYNSNKTKSGPSGWKVEPKTHKASPAGVAQIGLQHAFKPQPMTSGKGYEPQKVGPTGIANARQGHSGAGPGGGNRTIYKSGSQCPTPGAKELPKGRDILGSFGPERSKG
jgi:hypothetical protein